MEEAHALLARLDRIEALDREGAPPQLLLPELQALVREAEAWARRERDPRAEAAAAACATACDTVLGAAIVPA
ncbi:MAG: hypothetical protein ACXWYO_06975 [Gaiellaceae bacterium]